MHQVSLANITQAVTQTVNKKPGDTLHLVIQFSYQGPGNWQDTLYVNLYQYTAYVIDPVDAAGWAQTQAISVTDPSNTPVTKQVEFDYVIQSGRTGGYGVMIYFVNNKDAGVIYMDVSGHTGCVIIGAAVASTLSISPSSAAQNATRTITFAGFQPNASVNISVVGGGGWTATADSSGGGTSTIAFGDAVGSYTLQATDSYGHSASTSFTVTGTTVTSSLSISPVSAAQNTARTVVFAGFQPYTTVEAVVYNGGGWAMAADSSGGGTYSVAFGDAPGTYTVQVTDLYGHSASASFTITGTVSDPLAATYKGINIYQSTSGTYSGQYYVTQVSGWWSTIASLETFIDNNSTMFGL